MGIRLERSPFLFAQTPDEGVGIERRCRVKRQDATVGRIQGYHCPSQGVRKNAVDPLHQLQIEREMDIPAGLSRIFLDPHEWTHDPAHRIDLQIACASTPLERLFVLPLEAHLPHENPLLIVGEALGREFLGRDLTHVAQHVRHGCTTEVSPLRPRFDKDTGKSLSLFFEDGDGCEVGVDIHDQRLMTAHTRHQAFDPLVRKPQVGPQRLEGLPRSLPGFPKNENHIARHIVDSHPTIAIKDRAAGGLDRQRAESIGLRPEHVITRPQHLNPEELNEEGSKNHSPDRERPKSSTVSPVGMLSSHRTDSHPSPMTEITTSPTTAAYAAAIGA